MLEKYLRSTYQKILVDPCADCIVNKISPNQVSFTACLLGLVASYAVAQGYGHLGSLLLLGSGYLDTLDGTLARHAQQIKIASPFGAVLDIVCDRVIECAIIFALFALAPTARGWLSLAMLGSILICVTSFLVLGIFTKNQGDKGFYYSPGIIERPEAFVFFLAMILLPAYFNILAWIFIFLILLTAFIRLYVFYLQDNCGIEKT